MDELKKTANKMESKMNDDENQPVDQSKNQIDTASPPESADQESQRNSSSQSNETNSNSEQSNQAKTNSE